MKETRLKYGKPNFCRLHIIGKRLDKENGDNVLPKQER